MSWTFQNLEEVYKDCIQFLKNAKSDFPKSCNERIGQPKTPLIREGLETEKQLAKLAFRNLSVPIKNLFLGLTDIETNLAKSQKMVQESMIQQMLQAFEAHIDIVLQKLSHTQDALLDL